MKKRLLGLSVFLLAVGCGGFWLLKNAPPSDATLAGWSAGNIISDYVMTNKNAMSEAQIQSFLKSKNSCNDRDYNKYVTYSNLGYQYSWRDGHFVCMADESFDGESAAHIIWQAAQDYAINPQVLIVLLQKEQALITDTWPNWNHQYRSATGYGCPDTAACDSQYFGFKNQVRNAAYLFRHVQNNDYARFKSGTTQYVQYNPNAGCGGSNVYIANRATASLYRYTPYQPNQAALNAGYGTGDGCSAYGNRNFYNYFTDWFGSTQLPIFSDMDEPRQLYTNRETAKIDPLTGNRTEYLPSGVLINFSQKTYVNSLLCLRTLIDEGLDKRMCVPYSDLTELFSNMLIPRKLITKKTTSKIDPVTGDVTENLPVGLEIHFSQLSNYYENKLCLRTTIDQRLHKPMCVLYENLFETSKIYEKMIIPRKLILNSNTNKINPVTNESIPDQTIIKGQMVEFASKNLSSDGELCLRTAANTLADTNMCVLYKYLTEI